MKTRQNPKGFIEIKNSNFGPKNLHFWQKLYQFYLDINEQKYLNFLLKYFRKIAGKIIINFLNGKIIFKNFNILQEFAPFWHKLETRRKPETRKFKTQTRLSKWAIKSDPNPTVQNPSPPDPDYSKPGLKHLLNEETLFMS